jgi:hypothetical protein
MDNYIIYYSQRKGLIELTPIIIVFGIGIYFFTISNYQNGFFFLGISIIFGVIEYVRIKNKKNILVEFSKDGIITADGDKVKWKHIKSLSLKDTGEEENGLCILIKYVNKDAMQDYYLEKKELESSNYYFDEEKFRDEQIRKKIEDFKLGTPATYFEEFKTKEEEEEIFEMNQGDELKAEPEIYYTEKWITVAKAKLSKKELREIVDRFSNKVNKNLP